MPFPRIGVILERCAARSAKTHVSSTLTASHGTRIVIQLTDQPIDPAAVLDQVASDEAGAVVLFLGTARRFTDRRETESLDYECYTDMAERELDRLESQACSQWPLVRCAIVHRTGHLEIGEVSVAVAVSSAHRRDAFAATQWLMDRIKETVPIWKRENWSDGTCEWVHPVEG